MKPLRAVFAHMHKPSHRLVELIIANTQSPYIEMYNDSTRRFNHYLSSHPQLPHSHPHSHPHPCFLRPIPPTRRLA
jgi:hypothetical protein